MLIPRRRLVWGRSALILSTMNVFIPVCGCVGRGPTALHYRGPTGSIMMLRWPCICLQRWVVLYITTNLRVSQHVAMKQRLAGKSLVTYAALIWRFFIVLPRCMANQSLSTPVHAASILTFMLIWKQNHSGILQLYSIAKAHAHARTHVIHI